MANTFIDEIKKFYSIETFIVSYNGTNVQCYRYGSGSHVLLAFPSFPFSGLYYLWTFANIDKSKYSLVTFDLPGWAGLTKPLKDFSITSIAQISKLVLGKISPTKISLLGYSFGGSIALELAKDIMPRLDSLILVSSILEGEVLTTRYVFVLFKIFRHTFLKNIIRSFIIFRFKKLAITSNLPKQQLQLYSQLVKNMNTKALIQSIDALYNANYMNVLLKLEDNGKKIIVINSPEEPKMFHKQAARVRRRLKTEFSLFIRGGHNDFILKPDKVLIEKIFKILD